MFLFCWVPFFTCNVMDAVCTKLEASCTSSLTAFLITTWLGYMNSFVNPVIYTIFNPEFRKAFKKIMMIGTWSSIKGEMLVFIEQFCNRQRYSSKLKIISSSTIFYFRYVYWGCNYYQTDCSSNNIIHLGTCE